MPAFPHTYALLLPGGYSETPEPGVNRTPMEDGLVKQATAQALSMVGRPYRVLLRSQYDYDNFLIWYHESINRSGWFDWIDPRTQQMIQGRIPGGKIQADSTRKHLDRWIVEMRIETLGRTGRALNNIGVAGEQGFGVGIYPALELPYAFKKLAGTEDVGSSEYGNYQYFDGSIMCWVPAHYYKWGTGANGLALNDVSIVPFSAFASVAAANAAGYALHRAFYDGGAVKKGFFVDKYLCSNNGGVASSIALGAPLSSHATHNQFAGLTGAPANAYHGAIAAAKTRGANFFCSSRFIFSALALLSYAHGKASSSATHCAWFHATTNFPKGNNGNNLKDVNDATVTFTTDGFDDGSGNGAQDSSLTGSGVPFAKTTHNGQNCGVCDLNGNMYEINPGLVTDTAGTTFYVLKTSAAMKDVTGGNTLASDLWGAPGIAALYDELGATYGEMLGSATTKRYGAAAVQTFSEAVAGLDWQAAGLALPLAGAADLVGTDAFGKDLFNDFMVASMCPVSGALWNHGSFAGVWALNLNGARTNSSSTVGFRAASYL